MRNSLRTGRINTLPWAQRLSKHIRYCPGLRVFALFTFLPQSFNNTCSPSRTWGLLITFSRNKCLVLTTHPVTWKEDQAHHCHTLNSPRQSRHRRLCLDFSNASISPAVYSIIFMKSFPDTSNVFHRGKNVELGKGPLS